MLIGGAISTPRMIRRRVQNKTVVVFGVPGLGVGGIERHLIMQLHLFDRERYAFHIITLSQSAQAIDLSSLLPSDVTLHRMQFKPGYDWRSTWKLIKLLKAIRPDIVVSSMVFSNTLFRMLKPLVGYKVIAREHNTYTDKTLRHKLRDHFCSYLGSAIVAVSQRVADHASKQAWIPRRKFHVIPNGVDIDSIDDFRRHKAQSKVDALRKELQLMSEARVILTVARLKPQKEQILLLDAFAIFVSLHSEYVLCVVGRGPEEARLRAHAEQIGIQDKVIFTGYREDVYSFYAMADMFVLTSRIEGFPNVGLEALAFGLPFISTDVAGVHELIRAGENGYVVDRDPGAVADAMKKVAVLEKSEYAHMRQSALERVQSFSIKHNVDQYQQLFSKLVGGKHGVRARK